MGFVFILFGSPIPTWFPHIGSYTDSVDNFYMPYRFDFMWRQLCLLVQFMPYVSTTRVNLLFLIFIYQVLLWYGKGYIHVVSNYWSDSNVYFPIISRLYTHLCWKILCKLYFSINDFGVMRTKIQMYLYLCMDALI